jgi:predicted transcriptional regulator of viral defense system
MSQFKQRTICAFARTNEGMVSIDDCLSMNAVNTYYHNAPKYIGEIMSRLVKRGILVRIKPGHFKLKTYEGTNNTTHDGSVQSLFISQRSAHL